MSEHIQPAPGPHPSPLPQTLPERTPGVLHEKSGFNFALILKVGLGLIITAAIIHVGVWWLLVRYEVPNAPPLEGESSLALEDARRPLNQRLLDVPSPHLEGIERESSLLILRVHLHWGERRELRFFVAPEIRLHIEERPAHWKDKPTRLFELREGQEVSVTYHMPGGVDGGFGVATAVSSPPINTEAKDAHQSPTASRTITGTVVKVEPRSVEAARAWAEVQMERYGWADRPKEIARIPVADAMEEVLQSKAFRSGERKKNAGRIASPGRSNSGRGTEGDKP